MLHQNSAEVIGLRGPGPGAAGKVIAPLEAPHMLTAAITVVLNSNPKHVTLDRAFRATDRGPPANGCPLPQTPWRACLGWAHSDSTDADGDPAFVLVSLKFTSLKAEVTVDKCSQVRKTSYYTV